MAGLREKVEADQSQKTSGIYTDRETEWSV